MDFIFTFVKFVLKWILLLLLLLQFQGLCALQCANSTTSGPTLPDLPESYQVSVECNILDKGYTTTAKVYYDFPGNRATLKLFSNQIDRTLIFSYATNELFSVSSGYCTVNNLTASNMTELFGEVFSNGMPHIAPVEKSFKFGKSYGEVYIGNDTVRGIPVNHWQACTNFSQWNTIMIDYYFSAKWSTASSYSSVPVRAEVKAQSTLSNGSIYLLHHIYDFFDFIPYVDMDDTIFQTPTGVICPGRKSSKQLPKLPQNFYYRVEKVFTDFSAIVFEDVWYDGRFKFYRHDYRPLAPEEPLNTVNPTTEIHDYNTGVRYVLDQSTKDCKIVPLTNYSMDASQNITAKKINGSFLLDMKNPLQLFNLDWNYTYVGQTYTRNIFCDVYMARRSDLFIDGFVSFTNMTITFYFLAQEWTDVSDHLMESVETIKDKYGTPIQMDLLADETSLSMSYNFLDFNPEAPDFNKFDISQCYPETSKLTFQVTFPGTLDPHTGETLQEWAHLVFAQNMGVSNIRISNVKMDNDNANIFITATLLDKTLPTAEFTFFPNKSVETQDKQVISRTLSAIECAQFCVDNPTFRCESFDFCQDQTCRLSGAPISSGQILTNSTICSHFARTVKALQPEKSIFDAYTQLRTSVYNRTLQLNPLHDKTYTAIDVQILFGWLNPRVVPPKIPNQFSYKLQVTIPETKHVYSSSVWYDSGFNMIRYDPHYQQPIYPFYTTNPLTVIEDFNTGIQYVIDKVYQNCSVSQLNPREVGVFLSPNTTKNATWEVVMKDPFSIFRIDSSYKYVGQKTIRGMTCNLFESLRTDFRLPDNRPVQSVFRYAFLSDQWSEISDDYLGSVEQPIRLDITVLDDSLYMQYNFYDFDIDHPDISVYDIHQCNIEGKWKHFTLQFPEPFHPNLETSSRMFLLEGMFRLSILANVSILRLQRLRLDHDAENIYLSATLAQHPKIPLYFTKTPINDLPQHADRVFTISHEEECADTCLLETTMQCNSFYFCPKSSQCLLSRQHVPDGPGVVTVADCFSYSRTVQGGGIPISTLYAYILLKNSVFTGNFTISIPVAGTDQTKNYTAVGIKERFTNAVERSAEESAFQEFTLKSNHTSVMPDQAHIISSVSVDDCALACTEEGSFQCKAFSYDTNTQSCFMVAEFDQNYTTNSTLPSYLYSRRYSKMYKLNPGVTSQAKADFVLSSIISDDYCAKACTTRTDFRCRLFQYCANTQQCLLFKDRVLVSSNATASQQLSTCYQYSSPYINDFLANNSSNLQFTNVINVQMVTLTDCADICIQELGNHCKGFYYAGSTSTCYLTAATIDDRSGRVKASQGSEAVSCILYNRIYFPYPTSPASSTRHNGVSHTTTSTAVSTSSHHVDHPATTVPVSTRPVNPASPPVTCVPPSSFSPIMSTISTPSATVTFMSHTSKEPVDTNAAPQSGDSGSSVQTGWTVGIAFIMFAVGIVLGGIAMHVYRRIRGFDEMKTNFLQHEDI